MGNIPQFTRTVLPQNAQYGLSDVAVARGRSEAAQFQQNAEIMRSNRQLVGNITSQISQIKLRDAEAKNTTWVNEQLIAYKRQATEAMDAERKARMGSPDNFAKDFDKTVQKFESDMLKKAPSEAARMAFRRSSALTRESFFEDNLGWQNTRKVDQYAQSVENAGENLAALAYRAGQNGADVEDLFRDAEASAVAGSTFVAPEKVGKISQKLRQTIQESQLAGMVDADPKAALKAMKAGKFTSQPSFKDAVQFVAQEEGGFVSNDGGKGPTLYGVNSEANPEEYKQIKSLYDQGKIDEAKTAAEQTFKKKYWDEINADAMSPKMAYVALDGAVNQGAGAMKKLVAQAGGDPLKLIELRRERYLETARNNPSKQKYLDGWLGRLDRLERQIKADGLAPDVVEKYKKTAQSKVSVELDDDYSDFKTAAQLGVEIPEEKMASLADELSDMGMSDQAASVREYAGIQSAVVSFAQKPLTEQRAELTALKATVEGGDLASASKYAALESVLQKKQEAIKTDPWSFYSARDIVSEPQALDFSNQQVMAKELDNRRASVQQVRNMDGVTMPLFTNEEVDSLKRLYETAAPDEISAIMTTMGNSLKPQEQAALAQAMAPKSPSLAVAIAVGNREVGEKIIMGMQIDGLVTKKDVSSEVFGKLSGVITDPVRMDKVQDAIYSYYKVLQHQARDKETAVNSDRVDQAIADIVGPVVEIDTRRGWGGTSQVISYKDHDTGAHVDEDTLQDILTSLTDDRVKLLNGGRLPVGTSGAKFTAQDIYKTGRFVSDGDGMYAVVDEFGEAIGNEDGTLFRVDARKLASMIKGGK